MSQGRFANESRKVFNRVKEGLQTRATGKKVGMEDHPCQFCALPDNGPSMIFTEYCVNI
jgi:hypothetical protein